MSSIKQPCNLVSNFIAGAMFALAGIASPLALAAPIYSVDTFLGSATLANSGNAEVDALREFANDPLLTRTQLSASGVAVADDGQWYIDVGTATPGYFVLKFGTGTTNQDTHFFFKNDGAVGDTKLVWTNAQVNFLTGGGNCYIAAEGTPKKENSGKNDTVETPPDLSSCNITRLSHYAFGGALPVDDVPPTETEVPEPGSAALAGLGMLGFWLSRRRVKK